MQVTVVGGGVAGLGVALSLGRSGHRVLVLERDDIAMPTDPADAFGLDRRGAPQVRHSHAFLARLRNLLRDDYPDVLRELLAAGATEMRFGEDLPPTITDFERLPSDDDLVMLACRRTTFEWVLRRAVLAEPSVDLRSGVAVDGLITSGLPGRPHVTGVHLHDGTVLDTDLVVAASGRRGTLPEWLEALGAPPVVEEVDDTGIVYFSRFYRLRDGAEHPPRSGPIGGDLGYLKYGVFVGDNRTFSVTLATPVDDDQLRRLLADPVVFEAAARELVAAAPWLDGRAEPLGDDVHVMAGLVNRWRHFVTDGEPVATGVVAVGDAVLCTNPLYGRGCSTAFWGAHLLSMAIDACGDDTREIALSYDASLRADIEPWYRAGVAQDAEARRVAAALLAGIDPDGDADDPRTFMRGVFRDGLLPAMRTDAVVLRAFFRSLNLLDPPDAMAKDPEVGARVLAAWQQRGQRPPEPPLGPRRRADLLDIVAA
ncbi:MAG: FAD-dependent oxidoreductase [Ilumatobacteraceae bacterium]